ncbi:MAG: plasmid mobilization relaxosome protein MobC [Rhizobiaceae bacterium]
MSRSGPNDDQGRPIQPAFSAAAKPKGRPGRKTSPVTLRLTETERRQLEAMADGLTLSTYIRACLFAREEKRRKRRPGSVVADKKAVAEALALLGQSRIANNLNQLAYQANIGALTIEDRERARLDEAYEYVLSIRALLVTALGLDE